MTRTTIDLPVDLRQARWRAPDGKRGGFVPNGKLITTKDCAFLKPNWSSLAVDSSMWSARIFVGFNVGHEPKYGMADLIRVVRKALRDAGEAEDASFVYQQGVYTHDDGTGVVQEQGAQVILLNIAGVPARTFQKEMVRLANVILDELEQESVIVQIQKDGQIKNTIGVTETERELDNNDDPDQAPRRRRSPAGLRFKRRRA